VRLENESLERERESGDFKGRTTVPCAKENNGTNGRGQRIDQHQMQKSQQQQVIARKCA